MSVGGLASMGRGRVCVGGLVLPRITSPHAFPKCPVLPFIVYPRSLNISLHSIISDFARRRQSLKSKCSQIREFVYK